MPAKRIDPPLEDEAAMRAVVLGSEGRGGSPQAFDQPDLASGTEAISGSFAVGAWFITSADVNLRNGPSTGNVILSVMRLGSQVMLLQSNPTNGFYNVKFGGTSGWASGGFLNPMRAVRVDSGPVVDRMQRFADAVCSATGAWYVLTYSTHQPDRMHAVDTLVSSQLGVMPSDFSLGDRVAAVALNQWASFGLWYIIWRQRINYNTGRGWEPMEDRGSLTKNHYDHVHASVYL